MYRDETDTQDCFLPYSYKEGSLPIRALCILLVNSLVVYSTGESEFVIFFLSFSFGDPHSFGILCPYLFSYEWSNLR